MDFFLLFFQNAQMTVSLADQVKNFAATRSQLEGLLGGREPLGNLLSESLFLISVGTMDLLPCCNFYLTYPLNDNKTEVQRLIELYESTLTTLHGMGARKFGILNVGLLSRLPSVHMSRNNGDPSIDMRAVEFNTKLGLLLSNLTTKLNGFHYSLADIYGFTNATFANPSVSGKKKKQQHRILLDKNDLITLSDGLLLIVNSIIYRVLEHQISLLHGSLFP